MSVWLSLILAFSVGYSAEPETVDREHIRKTLKANEAKFRKCYDDYVASGGEASGKITIAWEINDKGEAQKALIAQDQIKVESVSSCMIDVINNIKFESAAIPSGSVATVSFPWVFKVKKVKKRKPKKKDQAAALISPVSTAFENCLT